MTGIVGQRASRKGALDGYRLWLRDRADVVITAQPAPTRHRHAAAAPDAEAGRRRRPKPGMIVVRAALLRDGQRVTVEGTVTVGTSLLDSSGRRTIVEDGTAAIEVYLAAPDATLRPGARVRVDRHRRRRRGARRASARTRSRVLGSRRAERPRDQVRADRRASSGGWSGSAARSSRCTGTAIGGRPTSRSAAARVLISGLAGSGDRRRRTSSRARSATITGIVKRPYPTATDRRFAIVPRQRADIALGRAVPTGRPPRLRRGPARPRARPTRQSGVLGPDGAIAGLDDAHGDRHRPGGPRRRTRASASASAAS